MRESSDLACIHGLFFHPLPLTGVTFGLRRQQPPRTPPPRRQKPWICPRLDRDASHERAREARALSSMAVGPAMKNSTPNAWRKIHSSKERGPLPARFCAAYSLFRSEMQKQLTYWMVVEER